MPEINGLAWIGRALIVGRGGLGAALAQELQRRQPALAVMLCGRTVSSANDWFVDLESPQKQEELNSQSL